MKQFSPSSGFTLVEMLVSIGLFSVVATMSVGTLLVLIEANGRAQAMQLVMTNFTFALDAMTREIRTGNNWYCDDITGNPGAINGNAQRDCGVGSEGDLISVVESGSDTTGGTTDDERRITYWLDPIYYGTGHGAIVRRFHKNPSNPVVAMTGPDIVVEEFTLRVTGTAPGDTLQPTATLFIRGRAGSIVEGTNATPQDFSLETTVVQRLLDVN